MAWAKTNRKHPSGVTDVQKMDKQKEAPFGCYGCPKINGQARGNETGKVEVGKSQPFHI